MRVGAGKRVRGAESAEAEMPEASRSEGEGVEIGGE